MDSGLQIKGRYRIRKYKDEKEIWDSGWINNLVTDSGLQLIVDRLGGNFGSDMQIDEARMGTGSTAANAADTALETPVVTGIPIATQFVATKLISMDFYMNKDSVPNGTYTEFGLFTNGTMFTRSIISPSFIKDTGENALVTYEISVNQT